MTNIACMYERIMGTSTTTTTTTISDKTFEGITNLIKLLPTGTVFAFRFLSPLLTNRGQCNDADKYFTGALLILCGVSCFLSSFTDSHTGTDGRVHYGIATTTGLLTFQSKSKSSGESLSAYKIRAVDFVHAFATLVVFAVIALLDSNVVSCFYPSFESTEKAVIKALPAVTGVVSSAVFVVFPSTRHGIGYAATTTTTTTT